MKYYVITYEGIELEFEEETDMLAAIEKNYMDLSEITVIKGQEIPIKFKAVIVERKMNEN